MTKIRKLPQALEDLLDIWCYIAGDNPSEADRYLDYLEAKLRLLASATSIGRQVDDLGQGLRSLPVGNYMIFYRQARGGIDIVRVLHGARDIASLFRDDQP